MELMGLNLIDCQLRLRGVRGSQPCISMNLLMNSVGNRFFGVGVVKGHGFVIFFAVGGQRLWTSLFLLLLQVATKIGIHHRISCGDNFTSKNFKKLSLVESFFNIRQDYSLQLRTLVGFPLITQKRQKSFSSIL